MAVLAFGAVSHLSHHSQVDRHGRRVAREKRGEAVEFGGVPVDLVDAVADAETAASGQPVGSQSRHLVV